MIMKWGKINFRLRLGVQYMPETQTPYNAKNKDPQ